MYKIKISVFLALGATLILLGACNNSSKPEEPVAVQNSSQVVGIDSHTSQNSLDYKGVYKGTIPTASGEGMDVVLTLGDSTYTRVITYIGKKGKPFEEKGLFKWNTAGNTITLVGMQIPNQYFVGENTLTQLDVEGEKIEGDFAEKYILRK